MADSTPLVLGFAGTHLTLRSKDGRIKEHIRSRYGGFASREESPPYSLGIKIDSSFDQTDPNSIDMTAEGESLSASSSSLRLEYEFTGGGGSGRLSIAPQQLFIDIENSLRILLAHLVLRQNMLLVHAAAFGPADGGRAGIFAGQSGAGKSTISGIAGENGLTVISDDMVLLAPRQKNETEVIAYPTPLGSLEGPHPKPVEPRRVAHIYFIEHGNENDIRPLDDADAYMRLLTVVPFTQISRSGVKQQALGVAARISGRVKSSVFAFRPDRSALLQVAELKDK